MFVEDLSSKYSKLSPYGTSVCGRTDGCGWTVRPRFWIFWTQIFCKHLLKQPLRPCKQEKVGSYMKLCCQNFYTSPVTHRSLKIALDTLGDRGLWGGSIIWKSPNCLNLDTRYLHVSLLLFFTSVFLESWTPTLLKILDFGFTVFVRRARTGRTDGVRTDTYGSVSKFTPIWNFYHVTSNFLAILLKFLALNWHSSTLLISIGSGDITDFRRPI